MSTLNKLFAKARISSKNNDGKQNREPRAKPLQSVFGLVDFAGMVDDTLAVVSPDQKYKLVPAAMERLRTEAEQYVQSLMADALEFVQQGGRTVVCGRHLRFAVSQRPVFDTSPPEPEPAE